MKSTKSSLGSHFKPSWINIKQSLREVLELGLSGSQFVSMEVELEINFFNEFCKIFVFISLGLWFRFFELN